MLLTLVIAYLLITIAVGLVAAKRVKSSADFAIAGRNLPLAMIITPPLPHGLAPKLCWVFRPSS